MIMVERYRNLFYQNDVSSYAENHWSCQELKFHDYRPHFIKIYQKIHNAKGKNIK